MDDWDSMLSMVMTKFRLYGTWYSIYRYGYYDAVSREQTVFIMGAEGLELRSAVARNKENGQPAVILPPLYQSELFLSLKMMFLFVGFNTSGVGGRFMRTILCVAKPGIIVSVDLYGAWKERTFLRTFVWMVRTDKVNARHGCVKVGGGLLKL